MNWLKLIGLVTLACMLASRARAEVIELPEEELAKESVLPVFDKPVSVRNRNVPTSGRVEADLMGGLALSEPIYNVSRAGVAIYYHPGENNAFGLSFVKNGGGVSSYAKQLHDQYGLDFGRAPAPDSTIMADWDWKMFYGKMSLTKETVLNLGLYTTLGAGMVKYQHKSYPVIAPGIGEKFYFGRNFALRMDLRLFMNQAPVPFLKNALKDGSVSGSTADPVPSFDSFDERMTYTTILDVGLSWLF